MKVAERTVVTMDYELRYADGELIESTLETKQPLSFVYGKGEVLPAIEKALKEKSEGDKITVTLKPEEAYGERHKEGVCSIPRAQFPPEVEIQEGMMLTMESEDGRVMPFVVTKAEGDKVDVDFNHPLAGETLSFDIYVRDVREATLEELMKRASSCGGGCDCGDGSKQDTCGSNKDNCGCDGGCS